MYHAVSLQIIRVTPIPALEDFYPFYPFYTFCTKHTLPGLQVKEVHFTLRTSGTHTHKHKI